MGDQVIGSYKVVYIKFKDGYMVTWKYYISKMLHVTCPAKQFNFHDGTSCYMSHSN